MFGDNKNEESNKSKVETVLGKGTKIEGDICTSGSLRVEGEIIGKIKAEGDLFVGESGNIKNQIEARNIIIAGRVESNVIAQKKLEILPSGILCGDIKTNVLKIEEGAKFIGSSQILKKGKEKNEREKKEQRANKAQKDS